jgi:hypothetical protein
VLVVPERYRHCEQPFPETATRRRARVWRHQVVELLPLAVRVTEYQMAVLWRKGSFGSDSEAGSRFAERLLTVVASCRQQGRPLLTFLVAAGQAALQGSPPPSLLPALQRG